VTVQEKVSDKKVTTLQQRDRVCPFGYNFTFSEALKKESCVPLHQDKAW
jgi:hypothetical protein